MLRRIRRGDVGHDLFDHAHLLLEHARSRRSNSGRISSDFSHALNSRKDNTVSVSVIREKHEQTLTLTLPNRRRSDLYEESFDTPQVDAETRQALLEAEEEIAKAKPDMELATRELERMKPEMERAQKELCRQQEELRKNASKIQEQWRKQQQHLREKVRHELRGDWTEI